MKKITSEEKLMKAVYGDAQNSGKHLSNAQQHIQKLPAKCFGVLPADKSLIQIVSGEIGYYPVKGEDFVKDGMRLYNVTTTEELANKLNESEGITKYQRKAMEHGSMFGWETKGADPIKWGELECERQDQSKK